MEKMKAFVVNLQELGFSNDQIVEMWKEHEKTIRCEMQSNKRKRQVECEDDAGLNSTEDSGLLAQEQKIRKYSSCDFLCDDTLGEVLSFINSDFCAFRLILVSKQFKRVVEGLKKLEITCLGIFDSDSDDDSDSPSGSENMNVIRQFIGGNLCKTIELLELPCSQGCPLVNDLITSCENIKYLKANLYKIPSVCFRNPTIEELILISITTRFSLKGANLCNLKSLKLKGGSCDIAQVINNYTDALEHLSIVNCECYFEEDSLILLKNLTTLEIELEWQYFHDLSKLPLLKKITATITNIESTEPVEKITDVLAWPHLEYLKIDFSNHLDLDRSEIVQWSMPNLSTLILVEVYLKNYSMNNNPSLSNLTYLDMRGNINSNVLKSICKCNPLYLRHLNICFTDKILTSISLKCLAESNFNHLEYLSINGRKLQNMKDFSESSKLNQLKELNFSNCNMDKESWNYLASSSLFPNLTKLTIPNFANVLKC